MIAFSAYIIQNIFIPYLSHDQAYISVPGHRTRLTKNN